MRQPPARHDATGLTSENPTQTLRAVAQRLSRAYVAHCASRAVLLTGSVGEGLADEFSDLDVIAYGAAAIPEDARLEAVRAELPVESARCGIPSDEGGNRARSSVPGKRG